MLAFALEKERNLQPVCALVEAQLIFAELSAATSAGSPCDIGINCHLASEERPVNDG
jgi:hypothetical protein